MSLYLVLNIISYNPPINFCAILLAELRRVVQNRRTGVSQYSPSKSIFAQGFCGRKETKQRVSPVFKFFNNYFTWNN